MRTVMCAKFGRELPGLEEPPFPGELGQRIYEEISEDAFELWKMRMLSLMNQNRLHMLDPVDRKFLRAQMEEFLFEQPITLPEGIISNGTKPDEFREI